MAAGSGRHRGAPIRRYQDVVRRLRPASRRRLSHRPAGCADSRALPGRGLHGPPLRRRAFPTAVTLAARFVCVSSQQRRCVCPGSYDPVTMGHVDVITRAASLYDEVVVAVLHNNSKEGTFSVEQRMKLIERALAAGPNVRIEAFAGRLLVDVCREAGAQAIVKG